MTSRDRLPAPVLETPPTIPQINWEKWSQSPPTDPALVTKQFLANENAELREELVIAKRGILVRDSIIEGAHATMVVQGMLLDGQSEAMHEKENRKPTDRMKVGKGRHMTDVQFVDTVGDDERKKKDKELSKKGRKDARAAKKKAREELEQRWKGMVSAWNAAVESWKKTTDKLRDEGVRPKDLPKRPKKPTKPKINEQNDDDSSSGSDSEPEDSFSR
jgi:hypothetical protein